MPEYPSEPKFYESSWRSDSHLDPRTGEPWAHGASLTCICGQTIRVGTSGFNGMNHHHKGAKHAKQLRHKIEQAVRIDQIRRRAREKKERLAAIESSLSSSPGKHSDLTALSERASSPPPARSSSPGAKENYSPAPRKETMAKLKTSVLLARQPPRPFALRKSDSALERDFFGDE